MKKIKIILISIATIVLTTVYIAGMSNLIEEAFQPEPSKPLVFGNYLVTNANGEIDPDDKDNTLYNNINKLLLFSEDDELNELKIIDLYKIYIDDSSSSKSSSEKIIIEVADNLINDKSFKLVQIKSGKNIEFIDYDFKQRTRDNNEKYNVIIFEIKDEGYYGFATKPGKAMQVGKFFIISIIGVISLYILLFVLIKSKRQTFNA